MIFTQYYLDCLSQASYLIADETTRQAAVVDPRRDIGEYLDDAAAAGLQIRWVIETHFHADFLSGHLELARATGAEIVFGAAAHPDYPIRRVRDGERIELGPPGGDGVVLEFLETPGHTPESISVVLWERASDPAPYGVLTGDTLFIGDVGRPDLLTSVGMTAEELARRLYDSLHHKLLRLPDTTRVYPAHGAGSACGKNLAVETVSTIGEQRRTNYALAPMTPEQFVAVVTEGQSIPPGYFVFNAGLNKADRALLDESPPPAMRLDEVLAARAEGAVVIDTRDAPSFAAGHLAGSVNVGLDGRFAETVGSVVAPGTPIVLVADPGSEQTAKLRLGRIGFDRVLGHLDGGAAALEAHPEHVAVASRLTAAQLEQRRAALPDLQLVDVRQPAEHAGGMLPGAVPLPLTQLRDRIGELDLGAPIVVYCAGGYRSSAAASLLRSRGARDVSDVLGGYGACTLRAAGAATG
jgi:glyoxylase-like metal-dependent hydrolase (beta-lactamase superfamily II)/rhodanese-related sulfurtransferase